MRRLYVAVYALCLVLFGLLCYWVSRCQYLPGDLPVYNWFSNIDLPFIDSLMRFVSFFGETAPAIIAVALAVIILFLYSKRLEAFFASAMPGLAALMVWLFKLLLDKPRPAFGLVNNGGFSFPSGHVTYACVFVGLLFYLLPKVTESRKTVKALRVFMLLFIVIMMVSRLYLGEHWLSDVLGGLFLGGLLLAPAVALYRRLSEGRKGAGAA